MAESSDSSDNNMKNSNLFDSPSSGDEYADRGGLISSQFSGYSNISYSFQSVISSLESCDDMLLLQSLNQLSIDLAIAQEDVLAAMPLDQLVYALVSCLQKEDIPDIVLYSMNCLTNILDTMPTITGLIVARGGIGVLSSKLMNFEFIDMAEQAIKLIEKISYESALDIVKEGVFETMMNTLDFFEMETQKKIWRIAINIAKAMISQQCFLQHIVPMLPQIQPMLVHRGTDMVGQTELVVDFFIALLENGIGLFSSDLKVLQGNLQNLNEQGMMRNLIEIIQQAPSLNLKVFKLLRLICKISPTLSMSLLSMGICTILKDVLNKSYESTSSDYLFEAFNLIDIIVPSDNPKEPIEKERLQNFREHNQYLNTIGESVIPHLIFVYQNCMESELKTLTLKTFSKLFAISPPECLTIYIDTQTLASFLSEVLHSQYLNPIHCALKIINICYDKIPQEIAENFTREGIIDRINALNKQEVISQLKRSKNDGSPAGLKKYSRFQEERESDSLNYFEQLIMNLNGEKDAINVDAETDEFLANIPNFKHQLNLKSDPKNESLDLCNSIIEKNSHFENKHALRTGKSLKKLAEKLEYGRQGNANEIWRNLISMIESDNKISFYEFSNSGIVEALWKWFNRGDLEDSKQVTILIHRLEEFLREFLKENSKSQVHLKSFLSLFDGAGNYGNNLNDAGQDRHYERSNRFLSQKSRLTFVYAPTEEEWSSSGEILQEFNTRNNFFSTNNRFYITSENSISFATIKNHLLMVKSKEDFNNFKNLFRHNQVKHKSQQLPMKRQAKFEIKSRTNLTEALRELGMEGSELERLLKDGMAKNIFSNDVDITEECELKPEAKNIALENIGIVMTVNGQEIHDGMIALDVNNKIGKSDEIKFRFVKISQNKKESKMLIGQNMIYKEILLDCENVGVDVGEKIFPYLRILKLFSKLNELLPYIMTPSSLLFQSLSESFHIHKLEHEIFQSSKISVILSRFVQDNRTSLPSWTKPLIQSCKFLVPFTIKSDIFQISDIGPYLDTWGYDISQKRKIKVNREKLLEGATEVMRDPKILKSSPIEFEYEDEVGTGVGPTLEFYSLVGKSIRMLDIWRNSGDELGLFPAPILANSAKVKDQFLFIGRLVGKSLLDQKQLDLPLSPAFWKLALNENLTLNDILNVDKNLAKTLFGLQEVVNKRNSLLSENKRIYSSSLTYKGTHIDDLCLTFVLPGYDTIELKDNGKNIAVTLNNLHEYIALVSKFTLMQEAQISAFREGLNSVIPIDMLKGFTGEELEYLICGANNESWEISTIQEYIIPAHGYFPSSSTFQNLLIVMSQFNAQEKRSFLQFVTGSPRLPVGGFASLVPKLTVVKKDPENPGVHSDEYLPSVMTCQNYLKVPDYSSIEILQRNLKYAMEEGYEAFHLS